VQLLKLAAAGGRRSARVGWLCWWRPVCLRVDRAAVLFQARMAARPPISPRSLSPTFVLQPKPMCLFHPAGCALPCRAFARHAVCLTVFQPRTHCCIAQRSRSEPDRSMLLGQSRTSGSAGRAFCQELGAEQIEPALSRRCGSPQGRASTSLRSHHLAGCSAGAELSLQHCHQRPGCSILAQRRPGTVARRPPWGWRAPATGQSCLDSPTATQHHHPAPTTTPPQTACAKAAISEASPCRAGAHLHRPAGPATSCTRQSLKGGPRRASPHPLDRGRGSLLEIRDGIVPPFAACNAI
jgi:hypothetical protein